MKIYLTGDLNAEWRETVTAEILRMRPDAEVIESHLLAPGVEFDANIVFAYVHESNEYFPATAFELGYACARGCKIILISKIGRRGADMLHRLADVYNDIPGALAAMPYMEEFLK